MKQQQQQQQQKSNNSIRSISILFQIKYIYLWMSVKYPWVKREEDTRRILMKEEKKKQEKTNRKKEQIHWSKTIDEISANCCSLTKIRYAFVMEIQRNWFNKIAVYLVMANIIALDMRLLFEWINVLLNVTNLYLLM